MKRTLTWLMFFCIANLSNAQSKITRIEPPNWWPGMHEPTIQLLVHGTQIASLDPKIDYPGIRLERVIKVENPNYLFLDLNIGKEAKPGKVPIQFFEKNKLVQSWEWELWQREPNAEQRKGFDNSDVIYLITPDRFANGDPSNDLVKGMREAPNRKDPDGRHGGDIEGIRQHLDYLADMGFTAIWPNPLVENNMDKYSYHGYAITDFYKTDPRFGNNESYRSLVREANAKGLKVIMDMVINHCGSRHWWMDDLPAQDWLNARDHYMETNHRKSSVQDPYATESDRNMLFDGWFVQTMPDLNQRNPLLANYLTQNSIWWVEYAGLSGIRMDTYPYPDPNYMAEWSRRLVEEYPNFNIVGEEWNGNPAIVAYWQRGKVNPNGYISYLPSLIDFPLQEAMAKSLNEKEIWGKGWLTLYEMLGQDFQYADPMNLVTLVDNHDMPRFYAQVGGDDALFKLGLTFLLTMRGIPQIYYGTEVLMTSPAQRNDGLIRSDFPGGWPGDEADAVSGKGLTARQLEAKSYLKNLLKWRRTASAVQTGKLVHFDPKDGVYVFFRFDKSQRVMVILNKNEKPYELELARFANMLEGTTHGLDVISGITFPMSGKIALPTKGALILDLK
jgi:glycosidase